MSMYSNRKRIKTISIFMLGLMGCEIILPTAAYALTGGPSQPEVQSFEPVGTTQMVDLFSGDFVYNIPLLDIDGFPVNMSYHSGVAMDDEASWVGLGWNINPGVVNRNLRGLPDDFDGEEVVRETKIKDNTTFGLTYNQRFEVIGANTEKLRNNKKIDGMKKRGEPDDSESIAKLNELSANAVSERSLSLGFSLGVFYNSYRGLGYEFALNSHYASARKNRNSFTSGLSLGAGSQSGFSADADLGLGHRLEDAEKSKSLGFGFGFNSRAGLHYLTVRPDKLFKNEKLSNLAAAWGSKTFRVRNVMFSPAYQNAMQNYSVNIAFSTGVEVFGVFSSLGLSGYYNTQKMSHPSEKRRAYGYMYAHRKPADDRESLMDFSRNNEGTFTKDRPFLHTTNFSYDAFNVSGEGTGGMFRAHRSDVGVVSDPDVRTITVGLSPSAESGIGNVAKLGFDLNANLGWSVSGKWMASRISNREHQVLENLKFIDPAGYPAAFYNAHLSLYEPFYFKNFGDRGLLNAAFYAARKGDAAVRIDISKGSVAGLEKRMTDPYGNASSLSSEVAQQAREPRSQVISYLTADQAGAVGLHRTVYSFRHNHVYVDPVKRMVGHADVANFRRDSLAAKSSMSEITVLSPDGRRYVYGTPAYNNVQRDFVFNVSGASGEVTADLAKGQVVYPAKANTLENTFGENHFYRMNEMPKYAHSFLLSGILSADYVDVGEDGITYDDLGTAVKFNYFKAYSEYRWRVPHGGSQENVASHNPGFKSDKWDDQGSYLYGEKEIWYVHSIESKNSVAFFYTSRRADAHQVKGINGQIDTSASFYKLDSIALYTKQELISGGNRPVKVVHFEYDYSLCPGVDNNNGATIAAYGSANINANKGKLTLRKVYFTYGRSQKGRVSPYQFSYSDFNPAYNIQGYDRWGNYKPTPSHGDIADLKNPDKALSNGDNPYVLQQRDSADKYTGAWHLNRIKLPSGGVINVEYESDDYGHVQHLAAAEMFPVIGVSDTSVFSARSVLYDNAGKEAKDRNSYVFFRLKESIPASVPGDSLELLKKLYFSGHGEHLYFKFLVDLLNKQEDYEFVSGYADFEEYGFTCESGGSCSDYDVGWVRLKDVSRNDKDGKKPVHPVSLAAMQMLHLQLPKKEQKLFGGYELPPGATNIPNTLRSMVPAFREVSAMFLNEYTRLLRQSAGRSFVKNKSFIRLSSPYRNKLGGGSRVKSVKISDSWSEMTGAGESATYGQEYDYTMTEKVGNTHMRISSGVAAYEPPSGSDENPFKYPTQAFTEEKRFLKLVPDRKSYMEFPLGEEFFPPASVGYARVTTRNIKPGETIYRSGTGRTVNTFYTARDFPTRVQHTAMDKFMPFDRVMNFLKVMSRERAYASQGFSVIVNDMHGKPKGQQVFQEGGEVPYTEVEYHYYSEYDRATGGYRLQHLVPVLNRTDGSISSRLVGKTVDMVVDSRHQEGMDFSFGANSNLDAFMAAIFPAAIPSFWPGFSSLQTDMGMVSATKVVQEFGLLHRTVVVENGASIATKNILFDGETGEVLMTETQNEYGDPVFQFTYPAHFAYEGMGPAYKNIGSEFRNQIISLGEVSLPNAESFLFPGDEVLFTVEGTQVTTKGWVIRERSAPYVLRYVRRDGIPADFGSAPVHVKVIRSGRRNMQGIPVGSFSSLVQPGPADWNSPKQVINATATEFSEDWTMPYQPVPYIYVPCTPVPCNDSCWNMLLLEMMKSPAGNPFMVGNTNKEVDPTQFEPWYSCSQAETDGCLRICYPFQNNSSFPAERLSGPPWAGAAPGGTGGLPRYDELAFASPAGKNISAAVEEEAFTWLSPASHGPAATNHPVAVFRAKKKLLSMGVDTSMNGETVWYSVGPCLYMAMTMNIIYSTGENPGGPPTGTTLSNPGNNKWNRKIIDNDTEPGMTIEYDIQFFEYGDCSGGPGGGTGTGDEWHHYCVYRPARGPVNPYVQGLLGSWRPSRTWMYMDNRGQGTSTDVRRDGTYSLNAFWKKPVGSGLWGKDTTGKWVWTEKMTRYNIRGENTETLNPLGVYSAALYGFDNQLPQAVGSNTKLRQLANDNFEDYDYKPTFDRDHFSFAYEGSNVSIAGIRKNLLSDTAHSGRFSIKVGEDSGVYLGRHMNRYEGQFVYDPSHLGSPGYYSSYSQRDENFSPDSGRYLVSAWVKQNSSQPLYKPDTIRFIFYKTPLLDDNYVVQHVFSSGQEIEGWRRIEGYIDVPDTVWCYRVMLISGAADHSFFDDLRIHPAKASMRTFVHDPVTLRLVAELDENNYATFYEYDEEGRLIRIKRETERGIVTIRESRTGIRKTDD
jgi:hypothetical protein